MTEAFPVGPRANKTEQVVWAAGAAVAGHHSGRGGAEARPIRLPGVSHGGDLLFRLLLVPQSPPVTGWGAGERGSDVDRKSVV